MDELQLRRRTRSWGPALGCAHTNPPSSRRARVQVALVHEWTRICEIWGACGLGDHLTRANGDNLRDIDSGNLNGQLKTGQG